MAGLGGFHAGRVEVELGAQIDRRDFELYEKKLHEIRAQVAKKEEFKAQLGADFNPRAFNAYQRELKASTHAVDEHVKATGRLRTAFGSVYGRGGAALAAAGGLYALVKAGKEAIQSASDINESTQKNLVLFGKYSKEIDKFSRESAASFGISRKAALEYTGVFGNLFRAFGTSQKGSAEMSVRLTKLAADMASFNNTSLEQALKAIQAGLVGQVRPLRQFGVSLSATALSAEALATGIVKANVDQDKLKIASGALELAQSKLAKTIKEHGARSEETKRAQLGLERAQVAVNRTAAGGKIVLDAQQKALAAVSLTTKQTAAAHGDFARTSGGLANQQRILQARLSDIQDEIGAKLLPTVLKATKAFNNFLTQIEQGKGAGGAFVDTLKFMGHNFAEFTKHVREDIDMMAGWLTGLYDGLKALTDLGSHLPFVGGKFRGLSDRLDEASDKINAFRKRIRPTGHEFDNLSDAISNMNAHLADGRGAKAFSGNLKHVRNVAHTNITDAVSDVHHGLSSIRSALSQSLKDLGVSGSLKDAGGLKITGGIGTPLSKAGGGWIGQRGMVGTDVVPAMLAPGEAVLNRHQQRIIEALLGEGFLDQLFARINTPHYFARGGLAPAVATLSNKLDSMFGLQTTSTTGGTHVPGSYHYQGLAADVAGSPGNMYRASEWIKSSGTYRSLLEGIHNPNLAVKNGQIFSGAGPFGGVWANHANHIHVALRSLGAMAAGGGIAGIQIPKLVGGRGALGAIAQATLAKGGNAANSVLSRLAGSLGGGGDIGGPSTGQWGTRLSKSQLASLWVRAGGDRGKANLMAAIALAESGGWTRRPNATGSGAYGLWQILGQIVPGNLGSPLVNARNAVAKYDSQGLGAWEAYTNGSYRQFLARGGRASHRKKPRVTAEARARDYIRPLRALQSDRIDAYDIEMAAVDDYNTQYSIREREYDLTDEELIRDDGTVDEQAVARRGLELAGLASIRKRILEAIQRAVQVVRRIIHTYNTILKRLRASLEHAKKKDRPGVKGLIDTYEGRLSEWHGVLKDLTGDKLPNASLDYRELLKERREVLGTKATTDQGSDTTDLGGGDLGGDTGGDITAGDTSGADADVGAQVSQLLGRLQTVTAGARINAAALAAFASPGDIGAGGQFAITAAGGQAAAGAPIAGAIGAAGQEAVTIVQNINTLHPGDPEILRAIADASVSGIGLQPAVSSSRTILGI